MNAPNKTAAIPSTRRVETASQRACVQVDLVVLAQKAWAVGQSRVRPLARTGILGRAPDASSDFELVFSITFVAGEA